MESSSSDVFVDALEYLPVEMESSSSDVFVDALEYLLVEMESSSAQPDAPKHACAPQNIPTEKCTKGRKGRACLGTAGKAVKHCFKKFITKVCPCVPAREPSHPSRQEPTAATDPLKPMFDDVQPSTSAVVPLKRNPCGSPDPDPDAAQNNPTGRKGRACLGTAGKAVKRCIKNLITKVCPCVSAREPSHTSRQEPTAMFDDAQPSTSTAVPPERNPSGSPDAAQNNPTENPRTQDTLLGWYNRAFSRKLPGSLKARYILGRELESKDNYTYYDGTRRSDGQKVFIKIIQKKSLTLDKSPEAAFWDMRMELCLRKKVQTRPPCSNIIELYDWCCMKDKVILILENPPDYMSLREFLEHSKGHLTKREGKHILRQIIVAVHHCFICGVSHATDVVGFLINPDTLQIKLKEVSWSVFIVETPSEDGLFRSRERAINMSRLHLRYVLFDINSAILPKKKR